MHRFALAAVAALLLLPATASAAPQRQLSVDLVVERFVVKDGRTYAGARATTRVTTRDGRVRSVRRSVLIQARQGATCRILNLRLEDLQLSLLGLNLNTSPVTLRITGDPSRTLGALFCRLAQGLNLPSVRRAALRSLNQELARRPMRVMTVRSALPSQPRTAERRFAQAPATCQVLRLVLGPLRLDLLGLIVHLYGGDPSRPVEVDLTATPGGGVLGDLFCQLANTKVTLRPPTG